MPLGNKLVQLQDKVVQKGVGALSKGTAAEDAESGAATAGKVLAGGADVEEGLGGLEAGLAASGAETGGLGFIASGIVGLIGALQVSLVPP